MTLVVWSEGIGSGFSSLQVFVGIKYGSTDPLQTLHNFLLMDTKVIVILDGFWRGIFSDILTYGGMGILFYINTEYLGNSWVIDVFALIMLIGMAHRFLSNNKKVKRFDSICDAVEYLESAKEE